MLACTAARAATHLEAIGIEELGVIGGVGVVEAEGCHRVPGVVPLGEHAEVCQGCEELGHVCDCTPNGTTNVAVELQWNNASPALRQCSLNKHRQLILMQTYRRSVGSRTSANAQATFQRSCMCLHLHLVTSQQHEVLYMRSMLAADLLVWPMEERRPTRPWWPEGPLMELPVSVPMLIMA
jgi:hypothetical protein